MTAKIEKKSERTKKMIGFMKLSFSTYRLVSGNETDGFEPWNREFLRVKLGVSSLGTTRG